jgi:hypothetical protein
MEPQNTQNTQKDNGKDRFGRLRLTDRIIGGTLTVLHMPGTGFLERLYENAPLHLEIKRIVLAL